MSCEPRFEVMRDADTRARAIAEEHGQAVGRQDGTYLRRMEGDRAVRDRCGGDSAESRHRGPVLLLEPHGLGVERERGAQPAPVLRHARRLISHMIPILHSPGVMMPGQFGPMRRQS